jgi:hypothetical protein
VTKELEPNLAELALVASQMSDRTQKKAK